MPASDIATDLTKPSPQDIETRRLAYVEALERELAGYIRRDLLDRAREVEAEIARARRSDAVF